MKITFSLVVCTFMRPKEIIRLLESIKTQTIFPDEIIIIDASLNNETKINVQNFDVRNLRYFFVNHNERGSAKQRNYGIDRLSETDVVCFLDDDVVLQPNYFEELLKTYIEFPDALGVGGFILDDVKWVKIPESYRAKITDYVFDGWKTKDNSRTVIRKCLGLESDVPPGMMPKFSHGRSLFPPSSKIYQAEQLIGCTSSFKREVLKIQKFDSYFEGYSLYEDTALSLKVSKMGKIYINTNAKLHHYHAPSGRPNQYKYGKMVVRNGWYVWRIKNPNPVITDRLKWHTITLLLTFLRFCNIFTGSKRKAAFTESLGRFYAWLTLFFNKPIIEN